MSYNGHKNWQYWNVSLWLNNDEGLYRCMQDAIRQTRRNRTKAAKLMLEWLSWSNPKLKTPDGASYSIDKIRRAMVGL